MATSEFTSSASVSTTVPDGFHYETKYIVLSYLGMLPIGGLQGAFDQGDTISEKERAMILKEQVAEKLRQLEDEISASFSVTGFDRLTSPVFNPAKPDCSVEDCLAAFGDKLAQQLDTHLATAVESLLQESLDYQKFRHTTVDLSTHTSGGWSKVVVPLVLLHALQSKGQPLTTLLDLGLRCLEEEEADYIIKQGGWGEIFNLVPEEERGVAIAEDSNDIYILSGEQHISPASSLLCTGNSSEQSSWQTESLPVSLAGHESWAQVAAMDPEDVKSLDSNEGVALAEEQSENNSSNSDIVHVEREEAELLEEGGEGGLIEESMISVLGTESELAELREEFEDHIPAMAASVAKDFTPPASLMSLEEPVVINPPADLSAEPSLISSEPELLPPIPQPSTTPPISDPEPAAPSPVPTEKQEPLPDVVVPPVPAEVVIPSPAKEFPFPPPEPSSKPVLEVDQETELADVPTETEPEPKAESAEEPVAAESAEEPVAAENVEEPVAADAALPSFEARSAEEPTVTQAEAPVEEASVAPVEGLFVKATIPPVEAPNLEAVEAPVVEPPVETPAKKPVAKADPAEELPVLLYGGAALVLLIAVVYSVLSFSRR